MNREDIPNGPNQNLFNALCDICDFIPLQEDMTAIIDAMEKDKKLSTPEPKEQLSAEEFLNRLTEDYSRRLKTVMAEIKKGGNDLTLNRLGTKASCYRSFLAEMQKAIK